MKNIMGRVVIVAYKPKPGKEAALKELIKTHLPRLKQEGLVTDRESIIMEASDGTVIEVFEWLSDEAKKKAHKNPVVQQMWSEYAEVSDYIPIGDLDEGGRTFSDYKPLN